MLAIVDSICVYGMETFDIKVEVDVSNGLPAFDIVGLPDTSVREAKERVRTAIRNSGFDFPVKRITVNLAPASIKKEGVLFDLPVAIGILAATEQIPTAVLNDKVFIGELSLEGSVRAVRGVLAMALHLKDLNKKFYVPSANSEEAALAGEGFIYKVTNLKELAASFTDPYLNRPVRVDIRKFLLSTTEEHADFADIKGQLWVKRAMEIAASGMHNILLLGSPGSGKTMLARRLPTIMPMLSLEDSLFITKLYSVAGLLPEGAALIHKRPFRAPHHTSSVQSMVGGGRFPQPGEISLASLGVLFLDELPEYRRDVLESLRQPLEDRVVNVTRVAGSFNFPAKPLLVAAMNPCPCGYLGDSEHQCNCTPHQIKRYISKVSGPMLDRIDMHLHVPRVKYSELIKEDGMETSETIRQRVTLVHEIQKDRYKGTNIISNAEMDKKQMKKHCRLSPSAKNLLEVAFNNLAFSARAHDKILRISRTIADLAQSVNIQEEHIAEALQYRNMDKIYQGI